MKINYRSDFTVRVLAAEDGHKLTQSADIPATERIVSDKIYLAVNDDPANYKEITQAEADEILAEQKRLSEADAQPDEDQTQG